MDKGQRASDTVIFKLTLLVSGALLSLIIWIAQCWYIDACAIDKAMGEELKRLENRITVIEAIMPEIRDSLKDIRQDLKVLKNGRYR